MDVKAIDDEKCTVSPNHNVVAGIQKQIRKKKPVTLTKQQREHRCKAKMAELGKLFKSMLPILGREEVELYEAQRRWWSGANRIIRHDANNAIGPHENNSSRKKWLLMDNAIFDEMLDHGVDAAKASLLRQTGKAIELCAGSCRLTESHLLERYTSVDYVEPYTKMAETIKLKAAMASGQLQAPYPNKAL